MKTAEDILKELKPIFAKVFDKEDIVITMGTTANDVAEWDSLNHIQVIVAIEKYFKIKFTATEIYEFQKVEDTVRTIRNKLVLI